MKKRLWPCFAIAGIFMLLFMDVFLIYMEYGNYQDKMELLYVTLASETIEESNLELVTGLLKGENKERLSEAKEQLMQYGYTESYKDHYLKIMHRQCSMIICLSAILYLLYLGSLLLLSSYVRKRRNSELGWLQECIIGLRDSTPIGQMEVLSADIGSSIQLNMESLASHIEIIKEQAATEKEETKSLVTDISHQLKTPVAALKTSFEVLGNQSLTQEEKEEFEARCKEQIKRLEELVSALLNISRMESGMIEIHRKPCCIFDTVVSAINRIYPNSEEKQIEISLEAEDEMQYLEISHDRKWLVEAIINILENAVKYSPQHSSITIRMIRMTTFLRIEIEDEGIGIKRQERNKVFGRFYRGGSDAVKGQPGSGVGLFLTRKITEYHYGTISVATPHNNAAGDKREGSIFVLQIPYQ